jgi:hypothetical protein
LYNRLCFGTLKTKYIYRFRDVNRRELAVITTLVFAMLLLGITANFVLDFLHMPTLITLVLEAPTLRDLTDIISSSFFPLIFCTPLSIIKTWKGYWRN